MGFEYVLCYICGEIAEEEWKEIYIKDMYLYLHFHTNCWLESGGEEQEDFETEEAKNLMQGLLTLRPIRLQELLENCVSIKAKRIFLYLAEYCNMPWLNKLTLDNISLGSGKRQVEENGQLDTKYQSGRTPCLKN